MRSSKPRTTRKPRRKIVRKPRRIIRANKQPENVAKITETLPLVSLLANAGYQFQLPGIVGNRAQALAAQYGLYRVAKISFRYKPLSDTFVSNPAFVGGGGAITVPYMYWKMNRFADDPNVITAADLKTMGAKPIRFDDKTVNLAYRPNILLDSSAATGGQSGQVKMTPWLNTDDAPMTPNWVASTTNHYGHFFVIEAAVNGNGATPVGEFEATVHYEFKNPRVRWGSSEGQPKILV